MTPPDGRTRSPAHLGATLRSVLVSPGAGFDAAFRAQARRVRTKDRPAEGYAPYVLSLFGGAAAMFLWLKASTLAGLRADSVDTYRWSFLIAAGITGALLGLAVQFLWGWVGSRAVGWLGAKARPADLRLVWGASAFPQVFALFVLLPLDLIVVGPHTFTSARLDDAVSSAWAALSIAVSCGLALWSLLLFLKGLEVATGLRPLKIGVGWLTAVVCAAALVTAFRFGAVALAGGLA